MPKSPHTFELWAAAHKSGDEYYRHLTTSLTSGLRFDDECMRLGVSYLNELQNLEQHLQTLEDSDDVRIMKGSNARFIELIREDLNRFGLTAMDGDGFNSIGSKDGTGSNSSGGRNRAGAE